MQTRPLPDLPLASSSGGSPSKSSAGPEEEEEGVYSTLLSPDHYTEVKTDGDSLSVVENQTPR